uniref:NADH-ubiquinone oxidoreductase chain 5 n=1 Tax=Grylloblatta sculleni TaxID=357321 RepID=Q2Q1L4_9NEOP|nr:NADH dehydrogenase subunit 5 [Grylloblatta sculleni]
MCLISFIFLLGLSFILLVFSIYFILYNLTYFIEWELLSMNSGSIVMTFLFDWMSLIFMSFVLFISSLVIFYSSEYMAGDFNMNRFIILVLMFVLSMMFLIISPNLISILLGWDGLGLVSYCLVIYYQNVKSYNAGMLTALSNRIGDVALLLSIAWMLNFGSWNYVFYLDCMKNDFSMEMVGGLVVLAAMTKSAQIPFSSWLPAAMAAPTPVSALVHSSTLVTAGVYLLIRFNVLLNSFVGTLLLLFASLTMFMSGLGANLEFDLKKIIALSTLSQLGLMMGILGLGFMKLAFFHLLTHALFKALLFMCAGSIIHLMGDSQDIRVMGGLTSQMPLTSSCFNVANMALCGMPFLAGFYSSDLILEMCLLSYLNLFSGILFFFSTGLTVCYSVRLSYYLMISTFDFSPLHPLNDSGWIMLRGMLGLLIMTILGGSMLSWLIFPVPYMICLSSSLKYLTLMVCLMGGWLGYLINQVKLIYHIQSIKFYGTSFFMGSMWFMPLLSTYSLNTYPLNWGYFSSKSFDYGWSEYFGGQGIYLSSSGLSLFNQYIQNQNLKIYLMGFMLWIIMLSIMFI